LYRAGFDVQLRKNIPFGVSWELDAFGLMGHPTKQVTLFDIGANVGQTAQGLVRVFPNSKIYSFEPVPGTFAKMQRNTAGLPQVECVNMAMGAEPGQAVMTSDRDGLNTILTDGVASDSTVAIEVGSVDDFCAARGIQRIDLLKIDTEGFETFVLKGANEMLTKGKVDFVVAECDFVLRPDQPHGNFFEMHDMLAPLGFTMASMYTGGVDERGWVWGNMLMMREGVAEGLPVVCSPNWK
jgi:FkbM family methyltransferase